jgi:ribonuclease HI
MTIEVYTDGSATTKDKPGGYGWVLVVDGEFHSEGSGSIPNATNNDAELEAALAGLVNAYKINPHKFTVTLVSDSQIILGWTSGRYRFKQANKQHKYDALMRLKTMMPVETRWVRGHAGDQWNERCDKLAGAARDEAMGVVRKPRSEKSKQLKAAIEKMRKTLQYVLSETLQMKADGYYQRDDFEDYCEDAINTYDEAIK